MNINREVHISFPELSSTQNYSLTELKHLIENFRNQIYFEADKILKENKKDIITYGHRKLPDDNLKAEILNSLPFGKGVFAKKKIKAGEIIARFNGIHLHVPHEHRLPNSPPYNVRSNVIQVGEHEHIYSVLSLAELLNHSCQPNCGILGNTALVAMREIEIGEELNWDYSTSDDSKWVMECLCRESNCRTLIKGFSSLPDEIIKKYRGYISNWLVEKYHIQ